jgi:N-acetylglucosaminyldiphosphoundecaprenol N-acetyl-beta-D-mannosaminyltransferase
MGTSSEKAQENINKKVDRNIVIDAYSPPLGFDQDEEECLRIVQRINQSGATVLAIGVGAPKQEKWISQYRQYLTSINIIFAIGATIDFEAGIVPRAPEVVSMMGVEWLYRLMMEPKRLWKRYLINDLPFIWLLLKQKMLS